LGVGAKHNELKYVLYVISPFKTLAKKHADHFPTAREPRISKSSPPMVSFPSSPPTCPLTSAASFPTSRP
jgi:hypothetical protein